MIALAYGPFGPYSTVNGTVNGVLTVDSSDCLLSTPC